MLNVNYIVSYVLYFIIVGIAGYVIKLWNAHSKAILDFKAKEEQRAQALLGQQNYNAARQIVVDGVYKVEQLAKENINAAWTGLDKHAKCIEFASANLTKAGLSLSDEDVFDIIKTTVGMINTNKTAQPTTIVQNTQTVPQVINPTGQITNTIK